MLAYLAILQKSLTNCVSNLVSGNTIVEAIVIADMAQVSNLMRTYELGHLLLDHAADWL